MTMTRSVAPRVLIILLLAIAASGCEIVGGIFKAGVWVGVIAVVVVLALVLWLVSRAKG